jgi:P63C domain
VRQRLERLNPKNEKGRRPRKHFQWLTADIGDPALREHLASVIALLKANDDWPTFMKMMHRSLPRYKPMPLFDEPNENEMLEVQA